MLYKSRVQKSVAKHTAKFAWRKNTVKGMGTCTTRWLSFAKKAKIGKFDLTFENIISFLEYLFVDLKLTYSALDKCSSFAMVSRKLVGSPLDTCQVAKIKKYLAACFNANPPIPKKRPETWDVNILLDYIVGLGDNSDLELNVLAPKTASLILLSNMCRLSELGKMTLSGMTPFWGGILFTLDSPTKTFQPHSYKFHGLQRLELHVFSGNKLLCPVNTVRAYLLAHKK